MNYQQQNISKEDGHITKITSADLSAGIKDEKGGIYSLDGKRFLKLNGEYVFDYVIRQGTEIICDQAFSGLKYLSSVTIPNSVSYIGDKVFSGCEHLNKIIMPKDLIHVGNDLFLGCNSLSGFIVNKIKIETSWGGIIGCSTNESPKQHGIINNSLFLSKRYEDRKYVIVMNDYFKGNDEIIVLNSNDLPNGIKFTNKYFIKNVLYICHPYKTDTYLPFDNYEYELFKEEMAELQLFLNYLGAKRVEITNREQTTNSRVDKDTSEFNVEGNYKVAKGSFSMESRSEEAEMEKTFSNIIINQSFRQPTKRFPRPKNIPWIDNNEQYLRIEEQVLTYGNLYNHKIVVDTESVHFARSEEKTSINAALKVIMSKAKGSYNESTDSIKMKHVRKTWTLSVDFFPPAEI